MALGTGLIYHQRKLPAKKPVRVGEVENVPLHVTNSDATRCGTEMSVGMTAERCQSNNMTGGHLTGEPEVHWLPASGRQHCRLLMLWLMRFEALAGGGAASGEEAPSLNSVSASPVSVTGHLEDLAAAAISRSPGNHCATKC